MKWAYQQPLLCGLSPSTDTGSTQQIVFCAWGIETTRLSGNGDYSVTSSLFPDTSPFAEELRIGNLVPQFFKMPPIT